MAQARVSLPQPTAAPPGGRNYRLNATAGGTFRYGIWRPYTPPGKGDILILPGFGEFIEKYHESIGDWLARGFQVACMEWYGQGLSTRALGNRHKVHIADFAAYVGDLARLADRLFPGPPTGRRRLLLGHSLGGHLALRYLHDHPSRFDGAVLSAAMIDIEYGAMPRSIARALTIVLSRLGLARSYAFGAGNYTLGRAGRFEGNPLTRDRDRFLDQHAWIAMHPELAAGGPTFGWAAAAQRSIALLRQPGYGAAIRLPMLLLAVEDDRIVSTPAAVKFVRELPNATLVLLKNAGHEILRERDDVRAMFWQQVANFWARLPA